MRRQAVPAAGRRRAVRNEGDPRKPYASRWHTVVCLASGPSLAADDVERVRAWRSEEAQGRAVIVANTTFRLAPWADVLYAMDRKWWEVHVGEVDAVFAGERCTRGKLPGRFRATHLQHMEHFNNSGAAAISLAAYRGAKRVLMLGYDCQRTGGKAHWHGDHPKGMGNAGSMNKWATSFGDLARALAGRGVEVINCTRETALTCFPRATLEHSLGA
jgi:hypothetical protein